MKLKSTKYKDLFALFGALMHAINVNNFDGCRAVLSEMNDIVKKAEDEFEESLLEEEDIYHG